MGPKGAGLGVSTVNLFHPTPMLVQKHLKLHTQIKMAVATEPL